MKKKYLLLISILIMSILTTVACSNKDTENQNNEEVKKQEVTKQTKDDAVSEEQDLQKIKDEAILGLNKFLGKEVNLSDLNESIHMNGSKSVDISWSNNEGDYRNYFVTMNLDNYEYTHINAYEFGSNHVYKEKFDDFDVENAVKRAKDFIIEKGYADESNLKFLHYSNANEYRVSFRVAFSYGFDNEENKTKVIQIVVDKDLNDIAEMSKFLQTKEQLEDKSYEDTNKSGECEEEYS